MARERLYIFDTTMRDGQQTAGVDFAVADKMRLAAALDALGVDYVEGGYPVPIRPIRSFSKNWAVLIRPS